MIRPAAPRPPQGGSALTHEHQYSIAVSDLVIVRWCMTCGEAHKIERYTTHGPFQSNWHRVKEQEEL